MIGLLPFILAVIVCVSGTASVLHAQPNVEVFWDPNNRADTVMDFGVTLEGFPVRLTFYVVNLDMVPVGILITNSESDPYYQIVNTPALPPEHPQKEEFLRLGGLPYVIAPGDTGEFQVEYGAYKNNPTFPPDVVALAYLELRIVKMTDTLGVSYNKRFLLRALKTRYSLASNTPFLQFDSVYVNPAPQPPAEPYSITNATSISIPVLEQTVVPKTSVAGNIEFLVDTLVGAVFAPHDKLQWNIRYLPHNTGRDSAHFHVVYSPNPSSDPDTVVVTLSGIGVQQQLNVDNAQGIPPSITVRGDTIDFGDVNADGGGGKLANIVIKNSGNIHTRYLSETISGPPNDAAAFTVEKPLREGGSTIRTNELDTLSVRFAPANGGIHEIRYVIETDIRSRAIKGIPDGVYQRVFVLRGFARKPRAEVLPASLDFGPVVQTPSCSSAVDRTLTVRNTGNVILRIDSIRVEPAGADVIVSPPDPVPPIDIESSQVLTVRYQPQQAETLNATLILYTNVFGSPVRIPLRGSSLPTETMRVRIPSASLKPGTTFMMPIIVEASKISRAQTSSIVLSFDGSLLRYRGSITGGTASEGAQFVVQGESPRGILTLTQIANGSFMPRDTFIIVMFDTYLGDNAATGLSLNQSTTMFGNAGCASIYSLSFQNGRFSTDSVCGLPVKTATNGTLSVDVSPNPAHEQMLVKVMSVRTDPINGRLYDMFGTLILEQNLESVTSIPVHTLPRGMYMLVVSQGTVFASVAVLRE